MHHWHEQVLRLTEALEWPVPTIAVARGDAHLTLAFSAPGDRLLTATEVNEWAWDRAVSAAGFLPPAPLLSPGDLPRDESAAIRQLRQLAALEQMAPTSELAVTARLDQRVALVTGSNGKTTTTRLIAAMTTAFGWSSGWSCTDGVFIGNAEVESGDWSGPAGAQRVVCDPAVTAAVLETARGGILRRGLGVVGAAVAVVGNVQEDHFGEYGVRTLADLAAVKLVTAKGLRPGGTLVLNAADESLRSAMLPPGIAVEWFDPHGGVAHGKGMTVSAWRDGDTLWLQDRDGTHALGDLKEMPLTYSGLADYNVANLLAASLAASRMGVDATTIGAVVHRFGERADDNAGRLTKFTVSGAHVLIDYAHNPSGLAGLLRVARGIARGRLLLLLGQAGNRSNEALTALAQTAWSARPDRIILKELEGYRRGREPGEVPAFLAATLQRLGMPSDRIDVVHDEAAAVAAALAWCTPGDVLVLPVHALAARASVLALLRDSGAE
ncbi:MAG: Mur ligase family protein [Gemmatimonadota bacterium]